MVGIKILLLTIASEGLPKAPKGFPKGSQTINNNINFSFYSLY